MRQLSRTDAPALRALAALCLSDPSNPSHSYGVQTEDVAEFWLDDSPEALHDTELILSELRNDGYVRLHNEGATHPSPNRPHWTPTARGWQAALMPTETVDARC